MLVPPFFPHKGKKKNIRLLIDFSDGRRYKSIQVVAVYACSTDNWIVWAHFLYLIFPPARAFLLELSSDLLECVPSAGRPLLPYLFSDPLIDFG